jgi:hemolysin III
MPSREAFRDRPQSVPERRVDLVVHVIGLTVALVGGGVLVGLKAWQGPGLELAGVAIYAIGLAVLFACSALYNGLHASPRRDLWCRLDQSGIFLMIAGTYTPFLTKIIDPAWATGLAVAIWSIAVLGIAGTIALHERFNRVAVGIYLVMGWLAALAIGPLAQSLATSTLVLLTLGGVLYSAGVVFHVWKSLPYQNAIWHVFVLVAAATHYAAVVDAVLLA